MEKIISDKSLSSIGLDITWPSQFPELKLIDDALRCGICYDYIKVCMVTPCAHSYCSICIRRSLHYKTACPTCFEETFETSLRNNRVLDRVTELFVTIKDKLIKHLRIAAIHFDCNEHLQSPAPSQTLTSQNATIPNATPKRNILKPLKGHSTKGKLNFTSNISCYSPKSDISKRLEDILGSPATTNGPISSDSDCLVSSNDNDSPKIPTVPPMFLQPKVEIQPKLVEVATVPCPVCDVSIPERNINAHLDHCLANVDKSPVKSPIQNRQKRNPLPKMVWSLMGDKDLRKKLKDYGLNSQGDKKTLISRIQRYILLFNSECDADNPRPVSEIIRQVEREEKQAPTQSQQRLVLNKKSDPKVIEEENKKYIQDNKESFRKLIETMKERDGQNVKPPARVSNRISSDDEDNVFDNRKLEEMPNYSLTNNFDETPSTSKFVGESINLCDSNEDDRSSSPILGGSCVPKEKEMFNGYTSESSDDILIPPKSRMSESNKNTPKQKKVHDNLMELSVLLEESPVKESNENSSPEKFRSSLSRSPSPSCIITAHTSDSDDSISLLINKQIDEEDFLNNATEAAIETVPDNNSQLDDPDFVVDTEQFENENCTEEVFLPRRKSKRKRQNSVLADSNQNSSPRRTRRCIKK